MKIIHIASVPEKQSNGVTLALKEYVKNQARYAEVVLLNLHKDFLNMPDKSRYMNISINQPPEKLGEACSNPDLVIIHGIYCMDVWIYWWLHIRGKYPYIAVPHGGLVKLSQKKSYWKKKIVNMLCFRPYFKQAECIQFLCRNEEKNSIVYNRKSIICGNGIYVPAERLYQLKKREFFQFVYVGRMEWYHKGLDLLLEAVGHCRDFVKEHSILFGIYGTNYGDSFQKLCKIIDKYGLQEIVSLRPEGVFGEEKKEVLLDADVFVQTSRSDGFSVGLLEALSYGIPVLVTNSTGIAEEYVNDKKTGILTEASIDSIADGIKKIWDRRDKLEQWSQNAYQGIKEDFEWDEVTKRTISEYQRTINDCQRIGNKL